jgi:hypothetical protein
MIEAIHVLRVAKVSPAAFMAQAWQQQAAEVDAMEHGRRYSYNSRLRAAFARYMSAYPHEEVRGIALA